MNLEDNVPNEAKNPIIEGIEDKMIRGINDKYRRNTLKIGKRVLIGMGTAILITFAGMGYSGYLKASNPYRNNPVVAEHNFVTKSYNADKKLIDGIKRTIFDAHEKATKDYLMGLDDMIKDLESNLARREKEIKGLEQHPDFKAYKSNDENASKLSDRSANFGSLVLGATFIYMIGSLWKNEKKKREKLKAYGLISGSGLK